MKTSSSKPSVQRISHTLEARVTPAGGEEVGHSLSNQLSQPLMQEGAGFMVRNVHRAFTKTLAQRLLKHELPSSQWSALRALWREDGYSQVELARRMQVEKASLTTVLVALEKKRFVQLVRSTEDRRKTIVYLTQEGRVLKTTLLPYAAEVNSQATKGISVEELEVFQSVLNKILINLE